LAVLRISGGPGPAGKQPGGKQQQGRNKQQGQGAAARGFHTKHSFVKGLYLKIIVDAVEKK
jgi:hypothetical protein